MIGDIFKPAADLVDNVHTSDEERLALRNQLAQIEAQMASKYMDLQMLLIESNSKLAIAEQNSGNWFSKSWRPLSSLIFTGLLTAMAFDFIDYNERIATLAGAFLGVYGLGRSFEKGYKK